MSKVSLHDESKEANYLPHHAVMKESTTTKLRVVFDASCKTTNGKSLNDLLMVGPTIQPTLQSILLRFRQHRFVLIGDIGKMYRQVWMDQSDRDWQRILWRNNPNDEIETYQLNTITYGTASAPYLAIRCLFQLAEEHKVSHPRASQMLTNCFCVDDMIAGANTIDELISDKREISEVLATGGFNLRKWKSNDSRVLQNSEVSEEVVSFGEKETKTLGLIWNPASDCLQFTVQLESTPVNVSKRIILSAISKIYDPLGLAGPAIIKFKILLQRLFKLKLNWDESVPIDIYTIWSKQYVNLINLNSYVIPRQVVCLNPVNIQIHAFCDASEAAYGCCIYLRSTDANGDHSNALLCAKSKVAPIQTVSLPRLELCSALLLSKVLDNVVQSLQIQYSKIYCWSDSKMTLAWMAGEPCRWKVFVANRVSEIQHLTSSYSWGHVRSENNPADVISRGLNSVELKNCQLWWQGPSWLHLDEADWPSSNDTFTGEVSELRKVKVFTTVVLDTSILSRYSTFFKLNKIAALCLRFAYNCKNKRNKRIGNIKLHELNDARQRLIILSQSIEFSEDINHLKSGKTVTNKSKTLSLNPFIDEQGLLMVGGRLKNSELNFNQKHPIIMSKNCPLTKLIVRHFHYKNLHAGAQLLHATIRTQFWIISGKNTIKRILRDCLVCFRTKIIPTNNQLMGQLPTYRVSPSRPFLNIGVDFAGFFNIKISRNKAYVSVFVCMVTKAVHLEVVSDLTTKSFLNALKRLIARRGKVLNIFSDNATNFVGANRELAPIMQCISDKNTSGFLIDERIQWHFIPPQSPHFGGLWEASVKSAKAHFKRVIGEQILSFEELTTVFCQIEACLNSRPISPISDDPQDLAPLTPGHFLIGESFLTLAEKSIIDQPSNRLQRYQLLTQMIQRFWQRWSVDYLNQLQQRNKWNKGTNSAFTVGKMVLVKEQNLPTLKWKLGRIIATHPGADGEVRVCTVKTVSGTTKRSVQTLCLLPFEGNVK